MREERTSRRKKLLIVAIVAALAIVLGVAFVRTYLNNTLTTALKRSLGTLKMSSVEYYGGELNITFVLENPTDFSITVEAISVSFYVNEKPVGVVSAPLGDDLAAGESTFFSFSSPQWQSMNIAQNQTYRLRVEGMISGSARYPFVETSVQHTFSETRTELHQPNLK